MKIGIVGGGVAGIFAAIAASKNKDNEVIIFEKNEKLGKKLFISGKGRCNVTNSCDKEEFFHNIIRNPKFLYSSYSLFSNIDLMELIKRNGCELKIERGKRVFPMSDKSSDIIKTLKNILERQKISVMLNTEVKDIKYDGSKFIIETKYLGHKLYETTVLQVDKLIIATGGLSYPLTGSTGDGYRFADKLGIKVTDRSPSLVPLNIKEIGLCTKLQGITLKNVAIKLYRCDTSNKIIYNDFGELLFTHFGVSGPIILSASAYIKDEELPLTLSIDLKPALSEDKLNDKLLREFANNNKKLKTIIGNLLPKSMVDVFVDRLEIDTDIYISEVDKKLRKKIIDLLKNFELEIISKRGYDEAIVTRGGVDVKEVNPKTMECKLVKGLYFAGEVLDIDALTGGFNIQLAATTGYVAGLSQLYCNN